MAKLLTDFLPGIDHTDDLGDRLGVAVLSDGTAWFQTVSHTGHVTTVSVPPIVILDLITKLAAGQAAALIAQRGELQTD